MSPVSPVPLLLTAVAVVVAAVFVLAAIVRWSSGQLVG